MWNVSRRILQNDPDPWNISSEKFTGTSISVSPIEETILKKLVSGGVIIGASMCGHRINHYIDVVIGGETLLRIFTSPIELVLHSYNYETNSITGTLTAKEIGLEKEVRDGDFLKFAQYKSKFLRKCDFCDHMAMAIWSVQAIGRCTCHDDYGRGHIHWDKPYIAERAFCPKHEAMAREKIEAMPIASRKDDQEGRLSEPFYISL